MAESADAKRRVSGAHEHAAGATLTPHDVYCRPSTPSLNMDTPTALPLASSGAGKRRVNTPPFTRTTVISTQSSVGCACTLRILRSNSQYAVFECSVATCDCSMKITCAPRPRQYTYRPRRGPAGGKVHPLANSCPEPLSSAVLLTPLGDVNRSCKAGVLATSLGACR